MASTDTPCLAVGAFVRYWRNGTRHARVVKIGRKYAHLDLGAGSHRGVARKVALKTLAYFSTIGGCQVFTPRPAARA